VPYRLKKTAIIVAGGIGIRMNSNIPKQFLLLSGRPLLMHCLDAFFIADAKTELVVVLPEPFVDEWKKLCNLYRFNIKFSVVTGGETRFHSVKNAIPSIADDGLVAIHDGVRPLVTPELINLCFDSAIQLGNAVPVVPVNDSIRLIDGNESRPEDRKQIRIVQTPQVFQVLPFKKAYEQAYDVAFTDDATVIERMGEKIHLIVGDPENLKITCPEDLRIAEHLLLANK